MTDARPSIRTQFETFTKGAVLDILLPRATDLDISKTLRDGLPEDFSQIPTRRNLFFDEKANVLLVLKTSLSEENVRTLLPNLEVTLAAHATDAVPQGTGNAASASGKHDLTSKTTPASEFMDVMSLGDCTYVIWRQALHLFRPRARLQRPAVYFTAHLTVSAEALDSFRQSSRDYLKSYDSLPANVLEPLQYDPLLSGSKIQLSETRITKVAPTTTRMHDDIKPVRADSKRAFPIVPALFSRIRYSALPDAVLASLHLETSQLNSGTVLIKSVQLDVPNVKTESLNPIDETKHHSPGDETVLLYKLTPISETVSPATVSVQINASGLLEQDSRIELEIRWQAQVSLSKIGTKATYKWSRPLSAPSTQHPPRPPLQASETSRSLDSSQKASPGEGNITFNFTGPATTTQYGEFKLDIQCINHGDRPRRFALVCAPPKRTQTKGQQRPSSEDANLIASIFSTPNLERQRPPDVLDLNPDVRIGPLPSGACYETEMRFRAMVAGPLDLGVIRIVDVDSRHVVDVRELPDIIALASDENLERVAL